MASRFASTVAAIRSELSAVMAKDASDRDFPLLLLRSDEAKAKMQQDKEQADKSARHYEAGDAIRLNAIGDHGDAIHLNAMR